MQRALCDPQFLKEGVENIGEVFKENGYSKKEVRGAMQTRDKTPREEETPIEEETSRGVLLCITMPNIPNFTPQFKSIARNRFNVANKTGVKDLHVFFYKHEVYKHIEAQISKKLSII